MTIPVFVCVVDFPDVGRSRRRWLLAESLILKFLNFLGFGGGFRFHSSMSVADFFKSSFFPR